MTSLTEVTRTLESPTMIALLILLAGLACWLAMRLRQRAKHQNVLKPDEEQRISAALAEQRVDSLRSEALSEEIRERRRIEDKLMHMAFHDLTTDLHNRAYLSERLQEVLRSPAAHHQFRAALLYIDLDHFNDINDMLGHDYGDRVLKDLAARIKDGLNKQDVLARMSGDEFTVLLCDVPQVESAFRLAQRILTLIEEPVEMGGSMFHLTATIGLCAIHGEYTHADVVLRDADLAMHHAKREGGSRVSIFTPDMYADAVAVMHEKQELQTAIRNEEFELYYQPLVNMRDQSIKGVEALLRWNHPTQGVVSPSRVIPLAEQTGHIAEIGAWTLRQACRDYEQLASASDEPLLMSVNISTRQLEQTDFVSLLRSVLAETQLPAHCLQLEITESILLLNPASIGALFEDIRALGVKLAFDDFGTGYSSLSYIERYPVDVLKIDQSFVRNIRRTHVNSNIVKFILHLAQATGMNTIAEGVESRDEATALIAMGCTIAQGFLYSKPVPLQQMLELLHRGLPSESPAATPRGKLFQLGSSVLS